MKYRLKAADGSALDHTIADTWARVAKAAAAAEPKRARGALGQGRSPTAMADFAFLPAGRILAGAGTGRAVTLFNCFVMGRIEDDLASIFDNVKEAALTMQQGGGIGHDFSTLRPKGALVKSIGADASGPVSFMDVWDAMCRTIMSAGARRGAMMATLRCDHPDIEAFIDAKADPARLRNFNLSVLVTDAFIRAVRNDAAWDRSSSAARSTARCRPARCGTASCAPPTTTPSPASSSSTASMPQNNLAYCEEISCHATRAASSRCRRTAPACSARSIWPAWSTSRSRAEAGLDAARLEALTATAVRFLDDVIDVSNYPLPAQKKEAKAKRRIGLGVTGLADALILCRRALRHARGGGAGRELDGGHRAAPPICASAELAREKGAFPLYDAERFLAAPNVQRLPEEVRDAIARHGMRNGLVTSIAPTGTISLLAGNVSSGIEPVFDFRYERRVLERDGTTRTETVEDYAHALYRQTLRRQGAADAGLRHRRGARPRARIWRCRPRCSATSTAPSPRPSIARPTSPSRPSRTSISRPTTWASRAARPTGPTR